MIACRIISPNIDNVKIEQIVFRLVDVECITTFDIQPAIAAKVDDMLADAVQQPIYVHLKLQQYSNDITVVMSSSVVEDIADFIMGHDMTVRIIQQLQHDKLASELHEIADGAADDTQELPQQVKQNTAIGIEANSKAAAIEFAQNVSTALKELADAGYDLQGMRFNLNDKNKS